MFLTIAQSTASPPAAPTTAAMTIPPWALWAIALIGLGLLALSIIRNSRKVVRSGDEPPMSEPQKHWLARRGLARAAPVPPTNQIAAAADQLLAQLDDRAARLEQLIAQADDRLAQLQRTTHPTHSTAPRAGSIEPKPSSMAPTPDSRNSQVYRLADDGQSPQQIAQITGVAISEVNLVLALRN